MTRLKALSVLLTREHVANAYGEKTVEQIRAKLSSTTIEELYGGPLIASDWISVQAAVEYLLTFDLVIGKGDGALAAELIRRGAESHFKGIYRMIFALTTPRTAIEKSSRIWSRFYDRGESIAEVDPNENFARLTIYGCPDMPKHHELLVVPYGDELLRCAGAKDVVSKHVQCVAEGAPVCITESTWK